MADDDCAVLLFTSGTTGAPKGVVLRHEHLVSYVLQTVELGSARRGRRGLVSVPPYHVAGVGTVLTNIYAGRRMVHLPDFAADGWLDVVAPRAVTNAMVVPTMLARIVDAPRGDAGRRPDAAVDRVRRRPDAADRARGGAEGFPARPASSTPTG